MSTLAAAAAVELPGRPSFSRTKVFMDTPVTIEVVGSGGDSVAEAAIESAFGWFAEVEARCSRFDQASELMQLCARPGVKVELSNLLFQAIRFAVSMAEITDGAFDPTVGGAMARRGFDTNYRTGATIQPSPNEASKPSYRDILLDPSNQTAMLLRPLTLDLGGGAKGLAIDLAAQALAQYHDFAINAGGDVLAIGTDSLGEPWRIGIRHPRELDSLVEIVALSGEAICTSGDYERISRSDGGGHLVDPSSGSAAQAVASVTVIAPTAMVADAFATAAFILGPERGRQLLEENGLNGLFITPALESFETDQFSEYRQ